MESHNTGWLLQPHVDVGFFNQHNAFEIHACYCERQHPGDSETGNEAAKGSCDLIMLGSEWFFFFFLIAKIYFFLYFLTPKTLRYSRLTTLW